MEQNLINMLIVKTKEGGLKKLTEREKKVLILRTGLEDNVIKSLDEVAKKLNITRERVHQIEEKALRKLNG